MVMYTESGLLPNLNHLVRDANGEPAKEEFSYPYPYVVGIDMLLFYLTDGYTQVEISLSYSVNCSARYRYMSTPRASHKKEASFETHW